MQFFGSESLRLTAFLWLDNNGCELHSKMVLFIIFPLLALLPNTFGSVPGPAPSTLPRHHHHGHGFQTFAIPPSRSANRGWSQTCLEPLTKAPIGSPCGCVLPMKVRLVLGVTVLAIFPEVTELEIEVAAGTYLKQSQVTIAGVAAYKHNQEKSVVDINLLPLGEKFDNTTASLTYERLLHKKVPLDRTRFGDYDVLHINYPGFPDVSSSGVLRGPGPSRSTRSHQYPIAPNLVGKSGRMSPRIIFILALSTSVLLVVCFVVLLSCRTRKVGVLSDAVSRVFTPSINKGFGRGSMQLSSRSNLTSVSFVTSMPASVLSVKTFALAELEKATEKFSSKRLLGEGGFGRVYQGTMDDGNVVAVKVLKRDNQSGDSEFVAEIEMLSRLHHRNLVKLIGICIEEGTRCLVYELVPNGSVESHLHGADRSKGPLDWDARLKIALGAARGLAYLHEDSNPRVIHRDFKASNVLLEADFTPKVSDFGLAREATEGSRHISTRVMGTFGYVAPEYAMTGHLLVKSDVYSYGVVLLELLTGRKPVDMSQDPGQENLVAWARPLLTSHEGLERLVDPSLSRTYDFDDMAKVAAIASMCVHLEVAQRPFMGEVVQALKLIYNDRDETCGDIYSPEQDQEQPSCHYSDFDDDLLISDGSWWGNEPATPRFMMECSSGYPAELESGPGPGLPTRHENRSGPLRIIRTNRDYYKLRGSMSEDRGVVVVKRDF